MRSALHHHLLRDKPKRKARQPNLPRHPPAPWPRRVPARAAAARAQRRRLPSRASRARRRARAAARRLRRTLAWLPPVLARAEPPRFAAHCGALRRSAAPCGAARRCAGARGAAAAPGPDRRQQDEPIHARARRPTVCARRHAGRRAARAHGSGDGEKVRGDHGRSICRSPRENIRRCWEV